jgi:hypothetical protein
VGHGNRTIRPFARDVNLAERALIGVVALAGQDVAVGLMRRDQCRDSRGHVGYRRWPATGVGGRLLGVVELALGDEDVLRAAIVRDGARVARPAAAGYRSRLIIGGAAGRDGAVVVVLARV